MKKVLTLIIGVLLVFGLKAQTLDTISSGVSEVKDSLGRKIAEYTFKDSLLNGPVRAFYPESGKIHYEGMFENNLPVGEWKFYAYDSQDREYIYQDVSYAKGKVHGEFIQFENGERVLAKSDSGTLDGYYVRELVLEQNADTIITQPLDSGRYLKGKRYSNWMIFARNGLLYQTGEYKSGMKHRQWKTYDTLNAKNELMREQQFFEGDITGKETVHYRYDHSVNPPKRIDEKEIIHWQMGTLNGLYIKTNKKGETLLKGNFLDSMKVEQWLERKGDTIIEVGYLKNEKNGKYAARIGDKKIVDGVYAVGKRNGMWNYYDKQGNLRSKKNFDRGTPKGEWEYYDENELPVMLAAFEEGKVILLEDIDDQGDYRRWDVTREDGQYLLTLEHVHGDSVELINYLIENPGKDKDPWELFTKWNKNHRSWPKNGSYSLTVDGDPIFSGYYKNDVKNGSFVYHDHPDINWVKEFTDGTMTTERFVDRKTKKPFTGDFILYHAPEVPSVEWEIENGLREGKSKWYNKEGDKIRKEKYELGVLQE